MPITEDPIRVLHVDDEPDFAGMVSAVLEREDDRFDVATATGASEGLEHHRENDVDCVVSDYDMPGRNGIEFLEAIRETEPDLPFILYTGKGSEEIASEAISAGVTDYLQKETGTDQYTVLSNRIANAVEGSRAQRDRGRQLDAIETAQEGISILDDGEFIYVNEAYADLYGYEPAGMIGEGWELLYRAEDAPTIHEEILPTVRETGYWRGTTTGLRADGSTFVEDHVLASTDRGELVCTVRDITAHKERQDQLEETLAKFEALFENSPDMIATHDTDGRLLDVNRRMAESLGYSKDELIGKYVCDVDPTVDPERAREFWTGLPPDDVRKFEGQYRRRDGSTFPVAIHLVRIDVDGDDRFLSISHDITDRMERERRLERQNKRLEEFASVLSHDLRNPLNVAQGRVELARDEREDDHLHHAADALDRIGTLIEDVLTVARDGEQVDDPDPIDLADTVEACWRNVETGDATLVVDTDRRVRADRGRLQQLLENLVRNAVEHAGPSVTVTVGDVADGSGFYVADDGPGIPPDEHDRAFESGYSTVGDGTGFGLSIVAQIAEAHGWEVRATDGADGGARLEITAVEFVEE